MTITQKENFVPVEICDKIVAEVEKIISDGHFKDSPNPHLEGYMRWYHHFGPEARKIFDEHIIGKYKELVNNEAFFKLFKQFELITFRHVPGVLNAPQKDHVDTRIIMNTLVRAEEKFKLMFGEQPNARRELTAVFYLNDDFEGGEIYFRQHELTIKPKKGMLLTFQGDEKKVHRVHPHTGVNRYSISLWFGK